ncbi:phenylalanine--tRNA ligase subunit alpha [uncultured Tyzzerella sp.]|uniref:phenylalanine--tRNA ligase subunit alpha n=1 Tax=uncultured Tyzzerella sp. TaxID=2321398 RepID=UPI002941EBA6|nr:phenylalanine--tRNA ligase subunit alpha [uncultured Tyzzerella sp.]
MKEKLSQIKEVTIEKLNKTSDLKLLEEIRVEILGKKGELTNILKGMGSLSSEERPIIGQLANDVRTSIEEKIDNIKKSLLAKQQEIKLKAEKIDVTMPAKTKKIGNKHPMTKVIDDIKNIFIGMGYEIAEGPEVETAYYNFEALNIPKNHPARDEQDTFYVNGIGDFVLRTQTSPVQVRAMESKDMPIKIIAPGRVYRSDEVDATHSPVFHQLEGLVIDKNITMGDLKGALTVFAKELLGEDTKVRFRPHHFPFTEPSAEMDASCFACGGSGCRVCKNSGWIELLGCGMVHPKVLEMAGIDPKEYSGFAFGMGLERVTMQKYAITDLRLLFENDIKFLEQF